MTSISGALRRAVLPVLLLFLTTAGSVAGSGDGPVPAVHLLTIDDKMYRLAAEGGYEAVVQVFPWRDIEPTRGEWHWEQPDFAVRAAEFYGLGLVVRLDHPPDWTLNWSEGSGLPPVDLDAYINFVRSVARRYRGQIQAYIVWNEPNLSLEWAGQAPDPVAYRALLCRAYMALRCSDPLAVVVSAGLAPTNGGDGAMDDRLFLSQMLDAGASACFDVLGVHAYGFGHPPDDPHGEHDGLNMARLLDLREIMQAYGANNRPIWITELGWTTAGAGAHDWQTVSDQEQADYLADAWRHTAAEWPWVWLVTVWNLSQGLPSTDEMAGYSLLGIDGQPKPAYGVLQGLLAEERKRPLADWLEHLCTAWRRAQTGEIPILAADEVVHLGDNQ